jgi:hypothetical protein
MKEMKANARRKGEKRAQGRKKGASGAKQLARPSLPFPFRVFSSLPLFLLAALAAASGRAASLVVPHSTGLPPMSGEKCIAGTGRGPYRGAKRCIGLGARILALSFVRSFFFSLWAKHRDEFV